MRAIKKIIKEPLVHFLIIGAFIFIVSGFIKDDYISEDYQIEITKQNVESMFKRWLAQLKHMPTQEEFDVYLENYLQNEILYREAKAMGLDNDDIIIKNRMVQKIEFLTNDLINISPPTEKEAKDYFKENTDKYTIPGKIDFVHIYFNTDNSTLDKVRQRANKVNKNLSRMSTLPEKYFEKGDPFILPYEFNEISKDEVERKFGKSELLENLFSAKIVEWSGPYLSTYGMHLVFIKDRQPPTVPDFEIVQEKIKMEIAEKRNRESHKNFMTELKKKYNIQYSEELKAFADSLNFPLKEI